jgi:papain like protease
MPKTVAPASIEIAGVGRFDTNAVPDPFDARDLEYRPRLQVLDDEIDQRAAAPYHIYTQSGQSCTGHAVAAVINHVLQATTTARRVSPYMLYRLARRYDQFPGEAEAGSSLRAAFKGWFYHGAALEKKWPMLNMPAEPDPDDEVNLRAWRDRPLGAFYRVNPFRLDDVQSAITELKALAVSGIIHDGWAEPIPVKRRGDSLLVIMKRVDAKTLGGHAYCLVGYNEVGFLVQNSWGTKWGKRGFATLPYEDWLDSAYDAWVARPGVPQTPFYSGRTRTATATDGVLATGAGPDLRRLSYHVVNTGNNGHLSSTGKFVSTPAQVERVMQHMDAWHAFFLKTKRADKRHIMIWSHGGGVAESNGLDVAQRQLNWWLNSGVFPISTVWQSGAFETLSSAIDDLVGSLLPSGGLGFDLIEQFDRLVEGQCRRRLRWAWTEMKSNARQASDPLPAGTKISFPASSGDLDAMADLPGASLLVNRLAAYVKKQGADKVAIHLAGHSAGSIYQASLIERLADAKLAAETMTWLAPAITVEEFRQRVVPNLGPGKAVRHFTCFDMSDALELDDAVGPVYHKSAVYLVARGFEPAPDGRTTEVPLVGLAKSWETPLNGKDGKTVRQAVEAAGGRLIVARSGAPIDARTDATTHAAFDNDALTMTSVVMRARGEVGDPGPYAYQANAPLRDSADVTPWGASGEMLAQPRVEARRRTGRTRTVGGPPLTGAMPTTAEISPPGEEPVLTAAESPTSPPSAPSTQQQIRPEVAAAPRTGSPILDVLQATGWSVESRATAMSKRTTR